MSKISTKPYSRVSRSQHFINIFEEIKRILKWNTIFTYIVMTLFLCMIVFFVSNDLYKNDFYNLKVQLVAELHGIVFDIVVLGILMTWLTKNNEKKIQTEASIEELNEYRGEISELSMRRNVKNLKRLVKNNQDNIHINWSYFAECNLSRINLYESCANYVNFSKASLVDMNFSHSTLMHGIFDGVYCVTSNFSHSKAAGFHAVKAQILSCDMSRMNLLQADFSEAVIKDTSFAGSNMAGVEFKGAILYNINFKGCVGLIPRQFENVTMRAIEFDDHFSIEYDKYCRENNFPNCAEDRNVVTTFSALRPFEPRTQQNQYKEELQAKELNRMVG